MKFINTLLLACLATFAIALPSSAQSPLCGYPTPWASNNGGTAGGLLFYDLNVQVGVRITAFDCNLSAAAGTAVSLEVYTTPTTHVGNETNAAVWTLVATDVGGTLSAARNSPTSFTLANPLILTPGNYGVGFRVVGSGQAYNGTGTTGSPYVVSNNEMTFTSGSAISGLFTGTFFNPRYWNGCIYYSPAAGLYPAFSATPTTGSSPLQVQFTDQSYSSDPGGITMWQWDFDNDGNIDSVQQSPQHTYTSGGKYTVKLIVTDATGQQSLTKTDLIDVDPITVNFTATPTSGLYPLQVQFTDTSVGGAVAWNWDFDNDGNIDSTLQNPSHTYLVPGLYTPKLTATNGVNVGSETKTDYINCQAPIANFTATPTAGLAPLQVQFTDTSTGNMVAWNWDFDNDGNVDSTLQNPTYTYTTPGIYTVWMQASDGTYPDLETKPNLIKVYAPTNNTESAELLEFQFNEPRGSAVANSAATNVAPAFGVVKTSTGAPNTAWQGDPGRHLWQGNEAGSGCMKADNATPYESIVQTNWPIDITGSHTVAYWTRAVTNSAASYAWGASTGSARCYNTGTYMSLRNWGNLGFVDNATDPDTLVGWHHYAVVIDDVAGTAQWYIDGVASGSSLSYTPGTFVFQTTATFMIGSYGTTTSAFSRYFDFDDFRLYARALSVSELTQIATAESPTASTFGAGCAGPNGVPTMAAAGGPPTVNNGSFQIVAGNLPVGVPQVVNISMWPVQGGLLPIDMGPYLGASYAGCPAEILPDFASIALAGAPSAVIPMGIPNDPNLAGWHLYFQSVSLASFAGGSGAVSPALDLNMQN